MSLFECLVVGGIEHVMLLTQRRLKPSISSLIARVYLELTKHSRVYEYEDIKGMKSSFLF